MFKVTLLSPNGRQASEQHQRGGPFPEEPRLERVVEPLTYSDNFGACLPSYSLTWTSLDGDT